MRKLITLLQAGEWNEDEMISRCLVAVKKRDTSKWVHKFVRHVLEHFARRPRERVLLRFLDSPDMERNFRLSRMKIDLSKVDIHSRMLPLKEEFRLWNLPEICTVGQLASWLRVDVHQLLWLADPYRMERKRVREACRHYRYRWIPRLGRPPRLLEISKERLKFLQRKLLVGLFSKAQVHDSVHAFTPGKSIRTYVAPHCGKSVVLHLDLKDFFWHITRHRVSEMIRLWGYPENVADLLANLVTNSVPDQEIDYLMGIVSETEYLRCQQLLRNAHIPQGAPTSPAISNLIAFTLDTRLSGLASAWGGSYSRYADDILISGDDKLASQVSSFLVTANAIILDEGFQVQHIKTKVMFSGRSQQSCGIVLNQIPNLPRQDFDKLKATLFNCVRYGHRSQNWSEVNDFKAHLLGKIGYWKMIHPGRAAKLQSLFDRINWEQEGPPAQSANITE